MEYYSNNLFIEYLVSLQNDWTPLGSAVFLGHTSTVKYLVNEANADCSKVPQVA